MCTHPAPSACRFWTRTKAGNQLSLSSKSSLGFRIFSMIQTPNLQPKLKLITYSKRTGPLMTSGSGLSSKKIRRTDSTSQKSHFSLPSPLQKISKSAWNFRQIGFVTVFEGFALNFDLRSCRFFDTRRIEFHFLHLTPQFILGSYEKFCTVQQIKIRCWLFDIGFITPPIDTQLVMYLWLPLGGFFILVTKILWYVDSHKQAF